MTTNAAKFKIGQIVTVKGKKAAVIELMIKSNDIRPEVKSFDGDLPKVKGIDFIGYIQAVPDNVSFMYGGETSISDFEY